MSEYKKFNDEFYQLIDKYPDIIQKHLYSIFTAILDNLDITNIISILMIGSGARNEISYKVEENVIDIFSDYEFVIIVDKMLSKQEFELLNKIFRNFEKEWNIKSPLFYIDYGVSTLKKFKLTPPTLWTYEAKNLGIVVYGRDIRKDLVNVTLDNLDYGNLNELIIVRLWNMLVHVNEGFIKRTNTKYEDFIIKFYYARNILDILTILLPNHNILIGGYRNRTNYFIEEFNVKRWDNYKDNFKKVTDLKVDLIDNISLKESQNIFYQGFISLMADIADLDNISSIEELEQNKNKIVKNNIFKEKIIRTLRRKFIEFQLFKKYYKYDIKSLGLFKNDRIRYNLLFLLLNLHKAIDLHIDNNTKVYYLQKAIEYFNVISYQNLYIYDKKLSFEDNFIQFRSKLLDFMMIWFYSRSNIEKKDIEKYMKWREK